MALLPQHSPFPKPTTSMLYACGQCGVQVGFRGLVRLVRLGLVLVLVLVLLLPSTDSGDVTHFCSAIMPTKGLNYAPCLQIMDKLRDNGYTVRCGLGGCIYEEITDEALRQVGVKMKHRRSILKAVREAGANIETVHAALAQTVAGSASDCAGEYSATFGASESSEYGMLLESVPWRRYSLVSGVIVGGAAQQNGVVLGSTVRAVDGLTVDWSTTAAVLAETVSQGSKVDIDFGHPCLAQLFNATLPAQRTTQLTNQSPRKRSKKRKQRGQTDWTALLHQYLTNFEDLESARAVLATSPELLDLGRSVSVTLRGDQAAHFYIPLVSFVLKTYNSLPLRRRPHKALVLARDLVVAGAPVGDEQQAMAAIHYAALCHSHALVRSILHAGGSADIPSSDAGGASPLHFILTLREPTVMLARELLMRNRAFALGQPLPPTMPLLLEAANVSLPMKRLLDTEVSMPLVLEAYDVRLAVHHWQQPLILSVLAYSRAPSELVAARDFMGRTALHLASKGGNVLALEALYTEESATATDFFGRSALHLAAMAGHTDVIEKLNELSHRVGFKMDGQRNPSAIRDPQGRAYKELLPVLRVGRNASARPAHQPLADHGGWSMFELTHWSSDRRCGIREVSGQMSAKDFVEEHLKLSRPVIMRGAARNWAWRMGWTKSKFQRQFSGRVFTTGNIPYPEIFGTGHENMTVAEYVRKSRQHELDSNAFKGTPPYIFHEVQGMHDVLLQNFTLFPPFLKAGKLIDTQNPRAVQFFLGAAGSGAPIHFHCDAWNVIAYGQKRWFLTPPHTAMFSNTPIQEWLHASYEKLAENLTECVQDAGDIIYVPCEWAHAVLNVRETIGMAVEFTYTYNNLT